MYRLEYYQRPNGDRPAQEWLSALEKSDKRLSHQVKAKLYKLEEEGLRLLNTNMLKPIKGTCNLYEIVALQARVCIYDDTDSNVFILLDGFLKKKPREVQQIQRCRGLLDEYLKNRNKKEGP